MDRNMPGWMTLLAVSALVFAGRAHAVWLAVDPGTQISLQVTTNGLVLIRPIGGVWSHSICSDVTAAALQRIQFAPHKQVKYDELYEILLTAVANGNVVNLNVLPETCHENGYPLITSVTIQPRP